MSSIDVCIVNYRGADDCIGALQALAAWQHGTVFVVDNSAAESAEAAGTARLRAAVAGLPWAQGIAPAHNLGFGRGCNLAFDRSQADYLLLLNPDARIDESAVLALAAALDGDAGLAAVAPRIFWNTARTFLLPCSSPQSPGALVANALASWSRAGARRWAGIQLARDRRRLAAETLFDVPMLAGAVLLLRRNAVRAVGGLFDPDYFMFFEDADLSLRLRRAGHRLAVLPAASAVHSWQHKPFKAPLMAEGRRHFFAKRFPRWTRAVPQIDRLARPVPVARWFEVLPQPVAQAARFAELTGGAGVVALSPSPLMAPAMFRPAPLVPTGFSDDEWDLLAPGGYAALLKGGTRAPRWVWFEKAVS